MNWRWLWVSVPLTFLSLSAMGQQADVAVAQFKGLSARLDPGFTCARESSILITTPAEEGLKTEEDIGILMGGVVGALNARCGAAGVPNLLVRSVFNGKETFRATYRKNMQGAWALAPLDARPPIPMVGASAERASEPSEAEREVEVAALIYDLELIARCDALAAHPADPEAIGVGVPDEKLIAAEAKSACQKAIMIDPQSPRLGFQLARAFLALPDGPDEDNETAALGYLLMAAEQEHGGALAYIGDYYLQGRAGLEADPEAALKLYKRGADAGFKPAEDFLSQVKEIEQEGWLTRQWNVIVNYITGIGDDYTQDDELQEGIVLDGYYMPELIQAAVYEDDAHAGLSYKNSMKISYHMADSLNNVCGPIMPREAIASYENREMSINNAMKEGYSILFNQIISVADIIKNPVSGSIFADSQAAMHQSFQEAPFKASENIMLLIERYGCNGAITQKFAKGLQKIILSDYPPQDFLSPLYMNACKVTTPKPAGLQERDQNFNHCDCILTRIQQWPAPLSVHRSLIKDFYNTALRLPVDSGVSVCSSGYFRR